MANTCAEGGSRLAGMQLMRPAGVSLFNKKLLMRMRTCACACACTCSQPIYGQPTFRCGLALALGLRNSRSQPSSSGMRTPAVRSVCGPALGPGARAPVPQMAPAMARSMRAGATRLKPQVRSEPAACRAPARGPPRPTRRANRRRGVPHRGRVWWAFPMRIESRETSTPAFGASGLGLSYIGPGRSGAADAADSPPKFRVRNRRLRALQRTAGDGGKLTMRPAINYK